MSRNLLPRFRQKPNPANIEALPPGRWTPLQNPVELSKLELPDENATELRTRIQSIPSPWARLHLFRNALEDPQHPAHRLVQNEWLDTLEFVWSQGAARGAHVTHERVRMDELRSLARDTGSVRVEDFADALVELAPRRTEGGASRSAVPVVSLLLVNGAPVAASSPWTVLFTAEDATREETRGFFRYASGAEHRPLARRPFRFQRYVAQVLLPQLEGEPPGGGDEYVSWNTVQTCVTRWLRDELRECRAGRGDRVRDQLSPSPDAGGWRTAAAAMHLEPVGTFGGLVLFSRTGTELDESRWRLRTRGGAGPAPIVVDPASFDGRFYEGAQPVKLPADLARLDRGVLPGVDVHHPWVHPQTDWLTDQIFLLGEPLRREAVRGLAGYRVQAQGDPRFSQPRLALPLRSEFFRWFAPDEVDRLLTIEVLGNGSVAVALTVPVGSDDDPGEVVVRRVYPDTHVLKQYGPELTVWPAFAHPAWGEYTVFRTDREQFVAENVELRAFRGGQPVAAAGEGRRTPLVRTAAFGAVPEILEFRSTARGSGDRAEPLGVVLPLLPAARDPHETRWAVGVDFGTSNTIVSVRQNEDAAADVFSADGLVLALTQEGAETREFLAGYFFPPAVAAEPFGTAVVHLAGLPHLDLAREPTAVRVNVPFSGMVRNDGQTNRVTGDLKWSPEREAYFLSAAFLRHVVATVAAEALRAGVRPENVSVFFSWPRSFSEDQVRSLEGQWRDVHATLAARGLGGVTIQRGLDESRSVLRHFFNAAGLGTLGAGSVVLDVGGGTTDLAAYGDGRTLLLDSVLLGGKNLTGPRQQGAGRDELTNPFVEAFVRWAHGNDLPPVHRAVLDKYLADRQIHLAFTYLVRTPWFASGQASRFWATPEFRAFQAMVFYFFAALFHYTGLAFRALPPVPGTEGPRLPDSVTLAGNGSQYLHWLTNLQPGQAGDAYRHALSAILRDAAGAPEGPPIRIEVTQKPKEEVARGLVAPVVNAALSLDPVASGPVVGERLAVQLRNEGEVRELGPDSRLGMAERFSPERLGTLRWLDGEMEGERFHASLLRAAESLIPQGGTWAGLPDRYRTVFSGLGRAGLRSATAQKLEYVVNQSGGYRGSVFILEATVVLERMVDHLFGSRP
ncbi:MAG TPA: hypothetical protein VF665_16950 [Longimicrobium sp.]|jgi:hypothetical protein|uniref:cell division protein FtsA n=1 Tax=Longimicrobium sp. TaxID=2029185 RepID=UPI002EDA0D73